MESARKTEGGDEWTERLARLFREHPAWVAAAGHLDPEATCTFYFSHREHTPWRIEQRDSETRLAPGGASDPDFVFLFTPRSIERLEAVDGGIGDFAVALFSLILDDEVRLRIAAGFPRLAQRGYLKLLLAGGPKVLAFGATHGIQTWGALRRFVEEQRSPGPANWEIGEKGSDPRER